MRDIHSRNTLTHKFNTGDKVDTAELDNPNHFTLLYEDDGLLYLMEDETMDQIEVAKTSIDSQEARWLQDGMSLKVYKYEGTPIIVQPPIKATFEVVESPASKSGDNQKTVTLENGERVRVPNYVEAGQKIIIHVADGTFSGRSDE